MNDCGLRGLDLLDAAIEHIEANPWAWEQETYRCETGMCVAGWMCELAGGQWSFPASATNSYLLDAEPDDAPALMAEHEVAGARVCAMDRAERLLGFDNYMDVALGDPGDHRSLFAACNTLRDIKAIRDDLRAKAAKS